MMPVLLTVLGAVLFAVMAVVAVFGSKSSCKDATLVRDPSPKPVGR